jgi:ferredoxin--NADP+ reductase
LNIPGGDLGNVFGSAGFVGWYNGHPHFAELNPDFSGQHAVVIGNGNVALDIARILAKVPGEFAGSDIVAHALDALATSDIRHVTILGRRGPHQIAMTPRELGELAHLERARPHVSPTDLPAESEDAALEPGLRKSVQHLRNLPPCPASKLAQSPSPSPSTSLPRPKLCWARARLRWSRVERTALVDGRAVGTGEIYRVPADLVISAIGYRTIPIEGVPYDTSAGRFSNEEGRIMPGLYCVGWARRGPSGTIGNRPDGFAIIDRIGEFCRPQQHEAGPRRFRALAHARGLDFVTFRDWRKIDEAEIARARDGAPREKFVAFDQMLAAAGKH